MIDPNLGVFTATKSGECAWTRWGLALMNYGLEESFIAIEGFGKRVII